MQNHNDAVKDDEAVKVGNCSVENVQSFQEEAAKFPYVGDKEPLSSLAAEYQAGSPILLEKIKILDNQYIAIRRTRGDGNCFFRSFMFSYLEHILESRDGAEVDRIKVNLFLEQLDDILPGSDESISYEELVYRSRDQSVSDYIVMFFRFVTAGEIRTRAEFFEPFITGLSNSTVDQFCKISVEPMGEESDHIHITALSDALGVAIRVVYLDHSSCDSGGVTVNHHDFVPVGTNEKQEEASAPFITLLYRPGHYDILYPKPSSKVLDNVEKMIV
ncbi:hypothetical protein Bca52824_072803 [Brassica carinata]|uniref:Ubiquitin thioesterase n=1 Tax=Brassica carinata TaxID=52824 RepID=A0A8X7U5A0_BRACI|nr:hypothetical protein Bca52824_072803 [Brassica carinata]